MAVWHQAAVADTCLERTAILLETEAEGLTATVGAAAATLLTGAEETRSFASSKNTVVGRIDLLFMPLLILSEGTYMGRNPFFFHFSFLFFCFFPHLLKRARMHGCVDSTFG